MAKAKLKNFYLSALSYTYASARATKLLYRIT